MSYCYHDTPREDRYNGPIDWSRIDPHKKYLEHLGNHFLLSFLQKNEKDMRNKQQASKELEIAAKCLDRWSKHPAFDFKEIEAGIQKIKDTWQGRI